jgi:hypothetical protein
LSRRTLHLLTGVDSAEFLRGSGTERTVCVCVCLQGAEASRIHLRRKREQFAGFEFFVLCRHFAWLNPPALRSIRVRVKLVSGFLFVFLCVCACVCVSLCVLGPNVLVSFIIILFLFFVQLKLVVFSFFALFP